MSRWAVGVWISAGAFVLACSTTSVGDVSSDAGDASPDASDLPVVVDAGAADAMSPECTKSADCTSRVCTTAGKCAAPTATDGVRNADETDIDCGGSAPKCDVKKTCLAAGDCTSGVCKDIGQGMACQAPAPDDAVKNGDETDVDCGGPIAPKCADDKACAARSDCTSDVCNANVCSPAICDDGAKNGTETDVDCGGPGCPRCEAAAHCTTADDCKSGVCKNVGAGLVCQPPSPTDKVMNGDETDIDCGGPIAAKCAVRKRCKAHADCTSDGCDYDGKCAVRKSCTAHYGGDTCGAGGAGGQGAASYESCCATAPAGAGGIAMDKYKITSGRMRVFMERTGGNVRSAVRALRAAGKIPAIPGDAAHSLMDPDWDLYLPTGMAGCEKTGTCDTHPNGAGGVDVELVDHFYKDPVTSDFKGIYTSGIRHVGGAMWVSQVQGSQGCSVSVYGTHSYWMNKATQAEYFGDVEAEFGQAEYDTKPINCTTYLMLQAFCLWDGGRLETVAEWTAAIGPANFPWGATPTAQAVGTDSYYGHRFPDATNASEGLAATKSIEHANSNYSYEYPHLGTTDFIVFLNAPGRLPKGNGPWGHADLAYSMWENTSNVTWKATPKSAVSRWAQAGSWEGHAYSKGGSRNADNLLDKYGKMSGRCVYP